jgi:hypothetical protein
MDFIRRMECFIETYILELAGQATGGGARIRIAVLDSGITIHSNDTLLEGGQARIIEKQNFLKSGSILDSYSHGTHIVRLLLRFAPLADIIVAKVSNSKQDIRVDQIRTVRQEQEHG